MARIPFEDTMSERDNQPVVYSCFIEPKTDRIYKIRTGDKGGGEAICTVYPAVDNGCNQLLSGFIVDDNLARNKRKEILYSSDNTEVLIIRFSDSMFPDSLQTLVSEYNPADEPKYRRRLSPDQRDSFVENESTISELNLLVAEITRFSKTPFTLVYTYNDISLDRNVETLKKIKIPYAVSRRIESHKELLFYLTSILSVWKKATQSGDI